MQAPRADISDETRKTVDDEVDRLMRRAYGRCKFVLEQNRELLDRTAQSLLENETIDATQFRQLVDQHATNTGAYTHWEPSSEDIRNSLPFKEGSPGEVVVD